MDIAKCKHEKIASVKIRWKEAIGLTRLEAALTQKVFGWIWKYPLGTFELDPSAAQRDVHPDAAKLFRSKSAKHNMTQMMAAMQLHPVEDSASEIELGKNLFYAAGIKGWLRVATIAGRTRCLHIVSWCLIERNFLLTPEDVASFVENCPSPAMLGEITTELSLLKPSKPQVFNGLLTLIFLEPEWLRLEDVVQKSMTDAAGDAFEFSLVLCLLGQLHLVGEFVINNVVQFWQRLAVAEMGSFAVALKQFAADVDGGWEDPKLPFGTKCLMSTNTLQFIAFDASGTPSATKHRREHFATIAATCRRFMNAIDKVDVCFVGPGGVKAQFVLPASWRSWGTLQRSTCKAMQVLKAMYTGRIKNPRKVRRAKFEIAVDIDSFLAASKKFADQHMSTNRMIEANCVRRVFFTSFFDLFGQETASSGSPGTASGQSSCDE